MRAGLIAIAMVAAMPTVSVPTFAEAQVLAGRSAARNAARPARMTAEERRENRIRDAEDQVFELDEKITEINTAGEAAGALSAAQQRQLAQLTARRDEIQRRIDQMNTEM